MKDKDRAMVWCPKCHGEGKLYGLEEYVPAWLRQVGVALRLMAVLPGSATLGWAFAHFLSILTGSKLAEPTGDPSWLMVFMVGAGVIGGLGVVLILVVQRMERGS